VLSTALPVGPDGGFGLTLATQLEGGRSRVAGLVAAAPRPATPLSSEAPAASELSCRHR